MSDERNGKMIDDLVNNNIRINLFPINNIFIINEILDKYYNDIQLNGTFYTFCFI